MSNPDFDQVQHELVPGTLRGYREWDLHGGSALMACNFPIVWHPGVNTAIHPPDVPHTHRHGNVKVPVKGCTCGFYAVHSPADITGHIYRGGPTYASGSIKVHGRVILGDFGFKAQFAEIEALVLPSGGTRAQISRNYPDVPIFDTMLDLIKEFPPIPVTELIGPPKPKSVPPQVQAAMYTLPPMKMEEFVKLMQSWGFPVSATQDIEEESKDS